MASIFQLANRLFARLGLRLVSARAYDPRVVSSERIRGSFPPKEHWTAVGPASSYFIHEGYRSREAPANVDRAALDDEWQVEVYHYAREICDGEGFRSVLDFGCGSGAKLIRFFAEHETVGIDVAETLPGLRARWPQRKWLAIEELRAAELHPELVICADVIEHVRDPAALLRQIAELRPKLVVLSTPERNLMRQGTHDGPPANPAHVREWSFAEFEALVSTQFEVVEHFISNSAQCTQCLLARLH